MAFEPEFATGPQVLERAPQASKPNELFRIDASLLDSPEWLREMVGSLEDEVETWERRFEEIPAEIAKLEVERLECQRDAAVAKLKLRDLRQRLAKAEGGAK